MIPVNFCGIECISGLMEKLIHAMQIIKVICPMEILKKKKTIKEIWNGEIIKKLKRGTF